MVKRFGIAAIAAASLLVASGSVSAQVTDPNKDESKCQTSAGNALNKYVGAATKCVAKCLAAARKTSGPYTGCFPPFSDPATNTCLNDSLKGAEAKAEAAIVKGCAADCPECYAPSVCSTGQPFVDDTETSANLFGPLVYCLEFAGTTPTKEEAKCEGAVSKSLLKLLGATSKCYTKCNQAVLKGSLPQGSCDPPTPADAATVACLLDPAKGTRFKAAAAIDKACAGAGANPTCYAPLFDTGLEWADATLASVNLRIPVIACGSPSGAFVE